MQESAIREGFVALKLTVNFSPAPTILPFRGLVKPNDRSETFSGLFRSCFGLSLHETSKSRQFNIIVNEGTINFMDVCSFSVFFDKIFIE
jgi:hypothetical protein